MKVQQNNYGSKRIRFSEWWEKLVNRKVGNVFTTFRKFTLEKFGYYESSTGEIFKVMVKNRTVGEAVLVKAEIVNTKDITEEEIKADTYTTWDRASFEYFLTRIYRGLPEQMIKLTFIWLKIV